MGRFIVEKCRQLNGTVSAVGAKNAALPILAATVLAGGECRLSNIPDVSDVRDMLEILEYLGCGIGDLKKGKIIIDSKKIRKTEAPFSYATRLRASFLIMGPLLGRFGRAVAAFPGGCKIGTRPVDLHLKGFAQMGARISQSHGIVTAKAKKLHGAKIYLDFPSVGATENIMMAATMADGITVIDNAATEPEITDLAKFLRKMGAKISGDGTETIEITGCDELYGAGYSIIPDRIEVGTLLSAVAISGGDVTVDGVVCEHLTPVTAKLTEMGAEISELKNAIRIKMESRLCSADISTLPYPGFPTDMQAQFSALLSVADGTGIIRETVFENRFLHLGFLKRMGANIKTDGRTAVIVGTKFLTGAPVEATDLRAGAALVLAGLAARGTTEISEIEHIERGYCRLDEKLNSLGANISRLP